MKNVLNKISKLKNKLSHFEKIQIGISIINVLVLGVFTTCLSCSSNEISKTQLLYTSAQMNPQFIISQEPIINEENSVVKKFIKITCNGGYFTNYDSHVFSIIEITCDDNQTYNIPLIGYWFSYGKTGNTLGVVEEIRSDNNVELFSQLEDSILETYEDVLYIEVKHYLKISYMDFAQTKQNRFYEIVPIGGTTLIDDEIYKLKKSAFDTDFKKRKYLDLINQPEENIKTLNNIINPH